MTGQFIAKNPTNAYFPIKNAKNYLEWPKILIFYNDFILKSLWSIQLIGMHFLKIKELKEFI